MLLPQLLFSTIWIPFICGLSFLLFFKDVRSVPVRIWGIAGAALPFLFAWILYFNYDASSLEAYNFQLILPTGLESFGIWLHLGLNGLSLPLFLLAAIVGLSAVVYALFSKTERLNIYVGLLLIMLSGLMGTFASVDLFFFYFFHEFALIPTFIMILMWGGVARQAVALEMTIYLTLGALLSLVGLIALYQSSGAEAFNMIALRNALSEQSLSEIAQSNIFALLFFGFGILVSLFPFHSWAPKGYAAAPTGAVMLHAGVLKKFGLYGLLQIGLPLLPAGSAQWGFWLLLLGLGNVLIIGLVTLAQKDLKQMIAYGSVMHMGYAFIGLGTFSILGLGGVMLLLVAHGLSVALLFLLTTCIAQRFSSFDMRAMGGLGALAPNLSVCFALAILASIGLPGFANFWGEFIIFTALAESEATRWVLYFAALGIIISAVYGLRAVASIVFGKVSNQPDAVDSESFDRDMNRVEKFSAFILLVALFLVGVFPKVMSELTNHSLLRIYSQDSSSFESSESIHSSEGHLVEGVWNE